MAWPYYPSTTGDAGAAAVLQSAASASGLDVSGLSQLGQVQLAVANLLRSDPSTVSVPAGDVASGTFGSLIPDTGIYAFPSQLGIGTAGLAQYALTVGGSVTASGGLAHSIRAGTTLVAAANNDVLSTIFAGPAFTPGAFTGLTIKGVNIAAFSVATLTTPGNPIGLDIGVITGTNASIAYGIRIAPPVSASTNYLIAHTTAATFNVTAAGGMTMAGLLTVGGVIQGNSYAQIANVLSVGGAADSATLLVATGAVTAGTSQYGLRTTNTWTATATTAGYGLHIGSTTAASAFTMTNFYGAYIDAVAKGAGSTITNRYGLFIVTPTDGGTLNYTLAMSGTAKINAVLPTSSAGLASGTWYTTAGAILIVP